MIPCAFAVVAAALLLTSPLSSLLYPSRPPIVLLPDDPRALMPEPREGTRYLIALCGPLLLTLMTLVIARAPRGPYERLWRRRAIRAAQLLAVGLVVACFVGQHTARWTNPYFNFRTLAVAAILVAAVLVAVPRIRSRGRDLRFGSSRTWRLLLGGVACAAAAVWILPAINTERSITWSQLHYDAPFSFDETFAVLNGLTPLADFNAQYASLLPYAIALLLLTFGKTLLVFTIAMCTLSVLALLAVYGVLRRASNSSLVSLLLFLPVLATSMFDAQVMSFARLTPGMYFPMFPLRYAGAYLLAWLVARRLGTRRDSRLWPLFVVCGLVTLNNFEFGIAAFAASLAALLVTSAEHGRGALVRLAGAVAGGLALALAAVAALTLARAGSLPDFGTMPKYSRLYGVAGYSATPMPGILGLPLIIYLTYAAAIGTAVARALGDAPNRVLTGMLAWSGVFGLAAMSYYVARSEWSIMPIVFSPWMLALALLTVAVVQRAASTEPAWRIGLPALTVLFGMGLATCSIAQVPAPWAEIDRIGTPPGGVVLVPEEQSWAPQPSRDPEVRRFIAATATAHGFEMRRGAAVALFPTTGHRIADAYGVVDVVPFTGADSMHTLEDFEHALDVLRGAGGNTVLLPWIRVRALHAVLERRGFRVLTTHGVRDVPIETGGLPSDAVVVEGLTKWVDTRHLA